MSNSDNAQSLESTRLAKNYISKRLTNAEILRCALMTWDRQQIAENVSSEAMKTISNMYQKNPSFFGNKSKRWILGGLFYLYGRKYGQLRTQKQIARSLDTNEMTVRASYRKWLIYFPDLDKR
jgi:transcription initiation factor TFIIIB Brf1 subunit/transcription initiation factor TFIIB